MSLRTLAILLVLVLLAGLGLYLGVERDLQHARQQELQLFPGFDAARVTRITAENVRRDWHLVLARDPREGWHMHDPIDLPANGPRADHLLSCALAASGAEVPASERDPARLGLDPPEMVLAIEEELDGQRRSERVEIGALDADGQHVNVRVRGSIVRVLRNLQRALDGTIDDFKTDQVLAFVPGEVLRVKRTGSIVREGSPEPRDAAMRLERGPEGWRAVEPAAVELDPTLIATWLQGLSGLRHGGYIDELGAPLARFGLDPPELELEFELGDGSRQTLRLGRPGHAAGADWRAVRTQLGCVWAVEQKDAWLAGFALEDLLDPHILRARREEISALTLHRADGDLYFTHRGKSWDVALRRAGETALDKPVEADAAQVENLLGEIERVELDGFRLGSTVEEKPEFPALWIQVGGTAQGGWIGPPATGKGGLEGVLFQRRGENACSIAPATLRAAITRPIEVFWSRKLVDIPEQGQGGLRIACGKDERVYVHNARGKWTRRGGESEAKELYGVLDSLCFLRAERYLPAQVDPPWDEEITVEFGDPLGNVRKIRLGRSRTAASEAERVEVIFEDHRAVAQDQTLHAKLLALLRGD